MSLSLLITQRSYWRLSTWSNFTLTSGLMLLRSYVIRMFGDRETTPEHSNWHTNISHPVEISSADSGVRVSKGCVIFEFGLFKLLISIWLPQPSFGIQWGEIDFSLEWTGCIHLVSAVRAKLSISGYSYPSQPASYLFSTELQIGSLFSISASSVNLRLYLSAIAC